MYKDFDKEVKLSPLFLFAHHSRLPLILTLPFTERYQILDYILGGNRNYSTWVIKVNGSWDELNFVARNLIKYLEILREW